MLGLRAVKRLTKEEHERRARLFDKRQKAMGVPEDEWRVSLPRGGGSISPYNPHQVPRLVK